MTEQVKYVIGELNKPPFSKGYNLISFDHLEPLQLLQVLSDVIGEIDPQRKVDVREEAADQTVIRFMQTLKVMKYKPQLDNMTAFRTGLVEAQKPVVYPIIDWLLKRTPDLKKRAYLAKYLVRIELPPDVMGDEQLMELYEQYQRTLEEFKDIHKTLTVTKSSMTNAGDIRKDISNMEDEKEQLTKRIERHKRRVESHPNANAMMAVARNLRMERDRETKLANQRQEQKNQIQHAEHRTNRLQQQLRDIRQASVGATPAGLLQRLEEETRANEYIVKERLPKELDMKKKSLADLQKVVLEPAMGQSDLDALNKQMEEVNGEISQHIEKRMMSGDPTDDKLSLFRQQAAIIANKKEGAAQNLRDAREKMSRCNQEAEDKREKVKEGSGEEVLKGDDFKRYVNKLRHKSTIYKKQRQEIAELRAEIGVLSRTEEILRQRDEQVNQQISLMESTQGIAGARATQENLEKVSESKAKHDESTGKALSDMSGNIARITGRIEAKKESLAPIIKELRPMRQKCQTLTKTRDEKKAQYDTCAAGLESNRSKLEQDVRSLRTDVDAEESRYHYINCMIDMVSLQKQRIDDEIKSYTSSDMQARKKTFREIYTKKVLEQENLGKGLRDKQKTVREKHAPNLKQMKMWKDFERLMDCKKACLGQVYNAGRLSRDPSGMGYGGQAPAVLEDDRLVL